MNFDCETGLLIEIGSVSSFQIGEEIDKARSDSLTFFGFLASTWPSTFTSDFCFSNFAFALT